MRAHVGLLAIGVLCFVTSASGNVVFMDEFAATGPALSWVFRWTTDNIESYSFRAPSGSNGHGLFVGGTPGYDSAFVKVPTAEHQIVEAAVYCDVDGQEDFSRMGIFARGFNGDFHGKKNCCFTLGVNSKTGEVLFTRRKQGYEWPITILDPADKVISKGWHTLRISAIDKTVTAYIDDKNVASAVTGACLENVCAGIFNIDPNKNKTRRKIPVPGAWMIC